MTPEQIAKETAERLVTLSEDGYAVFVGIDFAREFRSQERAQTALLDLRIVVAAAIAEAMRKPQGG